MTHKKIAYSLFLLLLLSLVYSCQSEKDDSEFSQDLNKRHRFQCPEAHVPTDPCAAHLITICFEEGDCGSGDTQEENRRVFDAAVEALNAVGQTSLKITIIEDCEDADIIYDCFVPAGLSNFITLGHAEPTEDGQTQIHVFSSSVQWERLASHCGFTHEPTQDELFCLASTTALHEIMHALGFGHNWNEDLVEIDNTNSVDPLSVMSHHNCNLELLLACNFLAGSDKDAIREVYPVVDPCVDCPDDVDPCDCPGAEDLCECNPCACPEPNCDCPEAFPEETITTCYCVCEYFDTFQDEFIEYSRTEVPCFTDVECEGFDDDSGLSRCFIEQDCELKEGDNNPEEFSGCSFCPCTTDADCLQGFTCQSNGTGQFMICLP